MSRQPPEPMPPLDPVVDRLVDIGRHLRETRQQRGEDLYDVADYLRIKPSYLFALEEGDVSGMPGRTYALGFLRTYADHLGYDGAEVVRGLKKMAQDEAAEALQVRQPIAENRLPSIGIVAAALLLAGFAYAGWHTAQSGGGVLARVVGLPGDIAQFASAMFEEKAAEESATAESPRQTSAESALPADGEAVATREPPPRRSAERVVATASIEPASVESIEDEASGELALPSEDLAENGATAPAVSDTEDGADGTGPASEDPLAGLALDAEAERRSALDRIEQERPDGGTASELLAGLQQADEAPENASEAAGAGATAPVIDDGGRVVLLATEASWIQVQSPARDYVQSRTLEPGERFVIPDRDDLALWTGNAGGLEVWVDGRNAGSLGASGAVRRDIPLSPEALLGGAQ